MGTDLPVLTVTAAWKWHVGDDRISGDSHFADLYGLTPARAATGITPADFFAIIHPQDRIRIRLAVGGMLRGAEVFSKEYRIVLADGTMRWVHARGLSQYDGQHEPTSFSGVFVDITEQKRVEEQLRIAETAGGIGTFEYVEGFGTVSVSAQFCALLGLYPARDLPVRTINSAVLEADYPIISVKRTDMLQPVKSVEFRIKRRDTGEIRWLTRRGEYLRDTDSSQIRFSGVIYDITEFKSIEEKLLSLSQRLELNVEERTRERDLVWTTSPDLLAIGGRDGTYRSVNPAWTTHLGYSESEMIGTHIDTWVHPDDLAATREQFARLFNGEAIRDFDNRLVAKDGATRHVSWQCIPLEGQFYATGRDITERRELEDRLRQAHKMEAVGQLTGGLAHDFNNILMGITGSLELMQTRLAQGRPTELGRYIDAAHGAATRASSLTHRLLAFSRRQTLQPKPTDTNRLIRELEELIRRTVGPSIKTDVVGAPDLWTTLVDPNQLENAILNLCINARDAMPDGGSLVVETVNIVLDWRAARERELEPGQYVSLSVADTGTGMPPDVVKRAFDPFYTTKPIGQGTGLGLSMIYGFARQSGGQIRIYSEIGRGTTMRLYLPRHEGGADAQNDGILSADSATANQSGTVLVVDDEAAIRMLVTDVLDELGYATIEAADSLEAMKVLESNVAIELLITDVGIPGGMNGRQVADAARTIRRGLKVLFITGYAENGVVAKDSLADGMQILTKPFTINLLTSRVKTILSLE